MLTSSIVRGSICGTFTTIGITSHHPEQLGMAPHCESLANSRACGLAVTPRPLPRLGMKFSLLRTLHSPLNFGFESFGFASWSGLQAPCSKACALAPGALAQSTEEQVLGWYLDRKRERILWAGVHGWAPEDP